MEETIEIDAGRILNAILKNIVLIIVLTVLGFVLFWGISKYYLTPKYTSEVSMYVNNNDANNGFTGNLTINDINASQKLVDTYIVILKNDEILNKVSEKLSQEYPTEQLRLYMGEGAVNKEKNVSAAAIRKALLMESVNDTEVLRIKATTNNPYFSARLCMIITEVAPDVLQRVVKAGAVEVIGQASPILTPSSPRIKRNAFIGAVLGIFAALGIIVIKLIGDNTVQDEDDLKQRLDINVLGEIPYMEAV